MSIRSGAIRGRTTKLVASVAIAGAAAAVAGLGTFGSFTDSTTPVNTTTNSGVLSIELTPAASYAVPASTSGLLPGDSVATPFDLRNSGGVDWASVSMKSWATSSSLLDTDPVNGLQLNLRSCSQSWSVSGPGAYSCAGQTSDFYTGPIVMEKALAGAASLTAGGTDHFLATIELPQAAGNEMKNLASQISFTLTATQRDGAAR